MATFNETRTPTSRKHVAEQGIEMSNGSKTFPTFWSHPSVFFLWNNNLKYKFSEFFLPLIDPLVATFNEPCAATFRKYVYEQGIVTLN